MKCWQHSTLGNKSFRLSIVSTWLHKYVLMLNHIPAGVPSRRKLEIIYVTV